MKRIFLLIITVAITSCTISVKTPSVSGNLPNLPDTYYIRTNTASYNNLYYFMIYDSKVYYKFNKHVTGLNDQWKLLPLPKKLINPIALSADDEKLIVINSNKQIYTMVKALNKDIRKFEWRKRWGFPFWYGPGYKLKKKYIKWDISFISPQTDKYILYPNGNKHDVGDGCTTIFLLHKNNRRISFIDPWLVNDYSNEITTPQRGLFEAINLSASGSMLFVVNQNSEMYTLLFDFDIAGMDDLFFNYSYHKKDWIHKYNPNKVVPRKVPRPLPIAGWVSQPKPSGKITDQISILKNGTGVNNHILYVEGIYKNKTGYFTKHINEKKWTFIATGHSLKGKVLSQKSKYSPPKPPLDNYSFEGKIIINKKPYKAIIPDFNPYAFYSTIILENSSGEKHTLRMYHNGTIRIFKRKRALTDKTLIMRGAIKGYKSSDPFLNRIFNDYKEINIKVTNEWIKIKSKNLKGKLVIK